MLRRVLVGLVAIGVLASFMGIGGFSLFTATTDNDGNVFTNGSIEISTSPDHAFLTLDPVAPGDQVTAPITVSNDSTTLQMRYAVTSTTTEDTLAGQLLLTIKSGVTTCTNAGFGGSGSVLYGPGVLGTTTPGTYVIGDPAQGQQSGDRTVNASASDVLCLHVSLPLSTDNSFQGLTTTATFTFDAEQTANNP